MAIRAHDIPHEWPDAVLAQAGTLRDEPTEADKADRVDLRGLGLVTVDGEDARDFDDAVYCEAEGSGFRVWVAIANAWRLIIDWSQVQVLVGPPLMLS